jgi:Na+-driven multidrug efflux pump
LDNTIINSTGGGRHYGSTTTSESRKPLVVTSSLQRIISATNNEDDDDDDDEANMPPSLSPPLKDAKLIQNEIAGMTKLGIPVILTYLLDMVPDIVTIILVGRGATHHTSRVSFSPTETKTIEWDADSKNIQQLHIDAVAIAIMYINIICFSPGQGLLTGLDTLCSQAYGANQYGKIGSASLTACVILTFFYAVGCVMVYHAEYILTDILGQPYEVSALASSFLRYLLPGVPFLYCQELIGTVYESRNNAIPVLISVVGYNIISCALGYYLVCVNGSKYGWLGAALARTIADILTLPLIVIAAILYPGSDASSSSSSGENEDELDPLGYLDADRNNDEENNNHNINNNDDDMIDDDYDDDDDGGTNRNRKDDSNFLLEIWKGCVIQDAIQPKAIIEFLTLGIPGMLQVMFEWVAFEILALLCGILPNGDDAIIGIGANNIVTNIALLTFMPYLGLSIAGSVRIGNALGAGDVHRAEVASNLTLVTAAVFSVVNMTLLLSLRKVLPWFFTTDLDIIHQAEQLLLLSAMYQIPDALNACAQGIFRGSGRQGLSAKFNFVAFYIIGLPLGYVLGIQLGYGVVGLWLGMTVGLLFVAITGVIVIFRSDWKKLAADAALRLDDDDEW